MGLQLPLSFLFLCEFWRFRLCWIEIFGCFLRIFFCLCLPNAFDAFWDSLHHFRFINCSLFSSIPQICVRFLFLAEVETDLYKFQSFIGYWTWGYSMFCFCLNPRIFIDSNKFSVPIEVNWLFLDIDVFCYCLTGVCSLNWDKGAKRERIFLQGMWNFVDQKGGGELVIRYQLEIQNKEQRNQISWMKSINK